MLALDHRRDFDALLRSNEPLALVRFGDGEGALLTGKAHVAANDEWTARAGHHWITDDLRASLVRNSPGYCVGLPPNCCLREYVVLHEQARAPLGQRTFATLFLHGNLHRMRELYERYKPIVVGNVGQIRVPKRIVESGCIDLDAIVEQMLQAERPMFVSAGPLANLLIDRYWQRQRIERRQTVLDVGSALDVFLTGKPTRYYHEGKLLSHHCELAAAPLMAGRPLDRAHPRNGVVMQAQPVTNRIVIGRGATARRAPAAVVSRPTAGARAAAVATANPAAGQASVGAPGPHRRPCAKCVKIVRPRS